MARIPEDLRETRQSLLTRLKNWEDREAWQEFFDTHWRFIYEVAVKAGLNDTEARDVVQDTVITVSKKIKEFKYDPAIGRFRHWLLNVAKWRISQQWRRRQQEAARPASWHHLPSPGSTAHADGISALSVPPGIEALWEAEWQEHVLSLALHRVKQRIQPKHYQIYDFYVLRKWPLARVTKALGVNVAQVYLVKSRTSKLLEAELRALGKHPEHSEAIR